MTYPCTIISDRYTGSYSGGRWTAWNLSYDKIPEDIEGDDCDCTGFWFSDHGYKVGLGDTPQGAYRDLINKLKNTKIKQEAF